jgi:putative ABC transport system permease protein
MVLNWLRVLRLRLRTLLNREAVEEELDEELRLHLEMQAEAYVRQGMTPEAARRRAVLDFGGVEGHREAARDARGLRWLEETFSDLRLALRSLARTPGFTVVAVATLALGIGANTTIFSAANAFVLRPADAVDPGRLLRIHRTEHSPLPYDEFRYVREHARSFTGLFAERNVTVALNAPGGNERVVGEMVSGDFFTLLGVGASVGRVFTAAEDSVAGAHPVAVLSHRYWSRRFGGDRSVVGRPIRLNGRAYEVVGVAREGFSGPFVGMSPELWVPMAESLPLVGVDLRGWTGSVYVTGRLRPGVSRARAEAELAVLASDLTKADPSLREPIRLVTDGSRGINVELRPLATGAAGGLLAVVALVLLIACANLSNLLLARAVRRYREMGIRMALGAGRGRLIRQLLTESLVLAVLGGVLGLALAVGAGHWLVGFIPADAPVVVDLDPDRRVLLYTLGLSLAAAVLFGLVPALRASSPRVIALIRDDTRGVLRSRVQGGLVVFQISLSLLLLALATLFLRSLGNARSLDPGFSAAPVLDATVDLDLRQYPPERGRAFYDALLRGAEALPRARSAALAQVVPLSGSNMETSVAFPGDGEEARRMAYFNVVGPRFFETVRIPVLRGREFVRDDGPEGAAVVVVNQAFAERNWPGEDALGKRLGVEGPGGPFATVVGVVANSKYVTLGEDPKPTVYLPFSQQYSDEMTLLVRSTGSPDALRKPLASLIASLDPQLPAPAIRRMTEETAISLLPARFAATLLGLFGGLALLLASVGIFGVLSFLVAQRTRELGIRVALGARQRGLVRLVLGETLRWVGIGSAIGLALAVAAATAARSLLYGVSPLDPLSILGAAGLLTLVAMLASWLPARRAARVDPMVALRAE